MSGKPRGIQCSQTLSPYTPSLPHFGCVMHVGSIAAQPPSKPLSKELSRVTQGNTRNFKLAKLFYILNVLDKKK